LASHRGLKAGLDVREWGDGPPLVFLHGLGPSGPGVVDRAAPIWAREYGFRVLAPALPGIGGSPALSREDYLPSRLATRVEAMLDALDVHRCALVGFSWGGTIASRIDPGRLEAIALIDVGYQSDDDEPPSFEALLEEFADADFAEPAVVAAGFHGARAEPPLDALPAVGAAGVPILLLAGTQPAVERREDDLAEFRRLVPSADVRSIEGGHNLLEDAPDETIPAIGEWLRGVSAGAW
jgi:pimeloyl-ACP methyl ester carboxylesterase